MNSLRSKASSSSTCAPRPMNTWRCTGSTALTRSPSTELSTGTSRQPMQLLPLARDDFFDDALDLGARFRAARHEELADRVFAGRRQRHAELAAFGDEEIVRNLRQHAAAVAERRVRADRAAMVEVDENLQALFEDRVRLAVLHVGDEADAAGIVLVGGVVEADRARHQRVGALARKRRLRALASSAHGAGVHLSTPLGRSQVSPAVARQVLWDSVSRG